MQMATDGDFYHWYPLFTASTVDTCSARTPTARRTPRTWASTARARLRPATELQQLVDDGIFSASVTYDIATKTFQDGGESPYFISGPWQTPDATKALGDDLMVCSDPDLGGQRRTRRSRSSGCARSSRPAKAKNPVLASTFLSDEVQTTEFMDGMFEVDPRPSAWMESFDRAVAGPDHQGLRRVRQARHPDAEHPADDAGLDGDGAWPSTRSPPAPTRPPR